MANPWAAINGPDYSTRVGRSSLFPTRVTRNQMISAATAADPRSGQRPSLASRRALTTRTGRTDATRRRVDRHLSVGCGGFTLYAATMARSWELGRRDPHRSKQRSRPSRGFGGLVVTGV